MSQFSSNLAMPLLTTGSGDSIVLHNEALVELDGLVNGMVKSRNNTSPPTSVAGDRYIVKATATGAWTGKEDQIAYWTGTGWRFYAPKVGWQVWAEEEKTVLTWLGSVWSSRTGDAVFAAIRTSNISIGNVGTWANIGWNSQLISISGSRLYTHSTSTNPERIIVSEAGEYEISANITFEASGTQVWNRVDVKLQSGTPGSPSDVASGASYGNVRVTDMPRDTVALHRVVVLAAGDEVRVQAQRGAGANTQTINVIPDTRITVRKV